MRTGVRLATRLALLALTGCAVAAIPALALAADPVYEVQLWADDTLGRSLLLVNVTLPEDVELPATIAIPFPDEAEMIWVGEIRGPDSSMDVERSFVETEVAGERAIELTLDGSRVAQYEADYRETEVDGEARVSTLEWTQSVPAEALWVAVQLPPGAEDIVIDPPATGETLTDEVGKTLHVYDPIEPLPGETIQVRVEYVQGEAPGFGIASEGADSRTNLIVGLVLLAVAGVALVAFLVRRSRGPHEPDEDDGLDEDVGEGEGEDDASDHAEADRDDSGDGDPQENEVDEGYGFDVDDAWSEEDE